MKSVLAIFVLGVLLGATSVAYAQPQAQGQVPPERRLTTDPPGTVVDGPWALSLSGFQGYDGSNLKTTPDATAASVISGPHSGESVRLSLQRAGKKTGYMANAWNTLIYHPGESSSLLSDTGIDASQWFKLGQDTTLSAGERANRYPYYNIGAFPGIGNYGGTDLARPFVPSLAIGGQTTGTFGFSVDTKVAHVIDQRNNIQFTYNMIGNGVTGVSRSVMHEVGGRYSHLINRTVGYHLGYSFGNSHFGGHSPTVLHNIDVGLDLHKSLSLTRRTTFSFTTGTTFIKATPANSAVDVGVTKQFDLLGHASLTHYIGQTWSAGATYDRGWQMLDALLVPYFADGLTAAIGGNLGKRSTIAFSSAWVSGSPLGGNSPTKDRALIESAWYQLTLGRKLTAYAQYALYRQRFTLDGLSAIDLPQKFNRNTARVGLTLVLPR